MDWVENRVASSIRSKIDNEREMKGVLGLDPALQSARQVVMSSVTKVSIMRNSPAKYGNRSP